MAYDFYRNLYSKDLTSSPPSQVWNFPTLPRGCLRWLHCGLEDIEIRRAVFQLGRHKAPGPDGIPTSFYQQFWPVVGDSMVAFIRDIFNSWSVSEDMNESLICLIPIKAHPEVISQIRPICLSNVIMKIVSKVIANRLKPLMRDLIGHKQASKLYSEPSNVG